MDPNLFKGNLELILLSILEREEMYGIEIAKAANERTDGYFVLNVGSLYPTLHKLEQQRQVTVDSRTTARGGAPVRYYKITAAGRKVLAQKRKAYAEFHTAITAIGGAG
jgi:PadR family transcriptional regulator, regulatory protein PadR